MNTEYTSDSDLSDDTHDLVRQGLASVKRKRVTEPLQTERPPERPSILNMDISHIGHPLCQNGLIGVVSTHGLNLVVREIGNEQNYNSGTAEVGLEAVAESRSARTEVSRRAGGRELSNEEMMIAYGELEREMNELRNNIVRKNNPSERKTLCAWRERVEFSRAEAYGNLETRTVKVGETTERVRERRYGGACLIEVVLIRDPTANATVNAIDAPEGRLTGVAHRERDEQSETTDPGRAQSKSIKKETTIESKNIKPEKRVKIEVGGNDSETRSKNRKKKKRKYGNLQLQLSRVRKKKTPRRDVRHITKTMRKRRRVNTEVVRRKEIIKTKKNEKDKLCRDKVKLKKRRKLEFLTDENSEDECP